MMKKLSIVFATIVFSIGNLAGQEIIRTTYYKSKYGGQEVSEKAGRVVEYTIKMPDGSICYKRTDKKGKKVYKQSCYKDSIPTGIWISTGGLKMDYNIEISYQDTVYNDIPYYDLKEGRLETEIDGNFQDPVFPLYENNFVIFIGKNLIFPELAAEECLQGRVLCQCIIDESGKVTDLWIKESAHKVLDIEAARVILLSPAWTPAKVNDKPVKVCITVPINFMLQ